MKYAPITQELFRMNRANLKKLLPLNTLAAVNANDLLPVNGDAVLPLLQNSDLFHLTGIEHNRPLNINFNTSEFCVKGSSAFNEHDQEKGVTFF